jgi:hypothetical protein
MLTEFKRKLEGKRPIARTTYRWKNNITIYSKYVRFGSVGCLQLAQDRIQWRALVNILMEL